MIYNRWGTQVELLAYLGKHKFANLQMMLVKVRYTDDGSEGFQFVTNLRADGGINEIHAAVDALPEQTLTGLPLRAAIREAS